VLHTLENPFEIVVTAEQVSSYKPGRAHFEVALQRLGLAPEQVLHVAESRYHDIEPAGAMGMPTVWVDRGASASGQPSSVGRVGAGATSYRVNTLTDLVELLGR
jgi:FMN phosphatase YigB (HAD superfamily)